MGLSWPRVSQHALRPDLATLAVFGLGRGQLMMQLDALCTAPFNRAGFRLSSANTASAERKGRLIQQLQPNSKIRTRLLNPRFRSRAPNEFSSLPDGNRSSDYGAVRRDAARPALALFFLTLGATLHIHNRWRQFPKK